jgi:hypothetical protein
MSHRCKEKPLHSKQSKSTTDQGHITIPNRYQQYQNESDKNKGVSEWLIHKGCPGICDNLSFNKKQGGGAPPPPRIKTY